MTLLYIAGICAASLVVAASLIGGYRIVRRG